MAADAEQGEVKNEMSGAKMADRLEAEEAARKLEADKTTEQEEQLAANLAAAVGLPGTRKRQRKRKRRMRSQRVLSSKTTQKREDGTQMICKVFRKTLPEPSWKTRPVRASSPSARCAAKTITKTD